MDNCPFGYTVPTEFFLRGAKECPFLPQKESGTQPASLQQLKAEIAALIPEFLPILVADEINGKRLNVIVEKLRQLSAV